MKKNILFLITALIFSGHLFSQSIDKIINAAEVERIERILSADSLEGRRAFTPAIDKAADFIASEFKKSGLQYFAGLNSYRQEFGVIRTKPISVEGNFDGQTLESKNIIVITTTPELIINNNSGYQLVHIRKDSSFRNMSADYLQSDKNLLVIVDTSFSRNFANLSRLRQQFKKNNSIIFVLSGADPVNYNLHFKHEIAEQKLANVVGVLPGKSRKGEYVVFAGHYDHLGIGKPDAKGDSIYNGANDDAAGTTAVIMLAKYFSQLKNNERTLIFVAFTAEEIGGYGSQYFSKQLNPDKVVAMFNIEMIGTESKWGTNSAYITGYERSDFGKILQANLADSKFHFEADPYPKQILFFRSDNATLARLGVPAHTISTSKMEQPPNNEPNYHKQSDEIGALDMNNMAEIIKSIAISSKTIVSGKDTPSRVTNVSR
ncbi:MAG TPA: M20/M25/M40 family metallo-hydrolase [Chitinophagaceae bacterium]|nr:M20/M25/M40 family metallo-hydrolase [Chitinophagaceae bacterium]